MKKGLIVIFVIIAALSAYLLIYNKYHQNSTMKDYKITQIGKNEVIIKENKYSPYEMIVKKGTSVLFINNDTTTHTVTEDNSLFDSGQIEPNGNYRHTFNDTGVFQYHCSIHPNMIGRIIVRNEL